MNWPIGCTHWSANPGAHRFVELFAAGMPTASASRAECVAELANGLGARKRVELNGQGLAGLAALCSAFLVAP